jgi:putative endonuclease
MVWYVYLIRCADESLYTGITTDVERRLKEHNSGKGSKAVRGRLPARLVHREIFSSRAKALKREAEIKKWPRKKKLELTLK